MHLGWKNSPVTPRLWLRSTGPMNKQIDAVDRGDRVALLDGSQRLDLDRHERFAIGLLTKLGGRNSAELRVEAAVVEAREPREA